MKLQDRQLKKIKVILKKCDVKRAHLFGSFARGDADKKSDIDILFEFKGRKSLFDHSHLKRILEEKLHKKVDVVTYTALSPKIKNFVFEEMIEIL